MERKGVWKQIKKQLRQRLSRLTFLLKTGWLRPNAAASPIQQYSDAVRTRIRSAKSTAILDSKLRGEEYEELGRSLFSKMKSYGLGPDDICADYGCGTLRVGRHVIQYLKPGAYWGLDIDQFLLDEGRNLLGEALSEGKRPNLRVISPESIAAAAAAQPAMVFSAKVLSHVHPDEVGYFIGNLRTIAGSSAQINVVSRWSARDSFQCDKWIWAHSIARLGDLVATKGGKLTVLNERHGVGKDMRAGTFRIVSEATVGAGRHE
jgi:hypothetical protein